MQQGSVHIFIVACFLLCSIAPHNIHAQGMVVYDINAPQKTKNKKQSRKQPKKQYSPPQREVATFGDMLRFMFSSKHQKPPKDVTQKQSIKQAKRKPLEIPKLMVLKKTGTAFLIDRDNMWMTARHVVEGCDEMYMMSRDVSRKTEKRYPHHQIPVRLISMDDASDTAIIMTPTGAFGSHIRPLKFSRIKTRRKGETAKSIGYPSGVRGEVKVKFQENRDTHVTGLGNAQLDNWDIKKRNTIDEKNGGLSGGPVLNRHGKIIGVNSAGRDKSKKSLGNLSTVSLDTLRDFTKRTLSGTNNASLTSQEKSFDYEKPTVRPTSHGGQVMKLYCAVRG